MKKIILCFLLLISSMQAELTQLDSIFINLDHSLMETDYLYEKQVRWADPLHYSGSISNDSINHYVLLKQLSQQFSYSSINDSSQYYSFENWDSLDYHYKSNNNLIFSESWIKIEEIDTTDLYMSIKARFQIKCYNDSKDTLKLDKGYFYMDVLYDYAFI